MNPWYSSGMTETINKEKREIGRAQRDADALAVHHAETPNALVAKERLALVHEIGLRGHAEMQTDIELAEKQEAAMYPGGRIPEHVKVHPFHDLDHEREFELIAMRILGIIRDTGLEADPPVELVTEADVIAVRIGAAFHDSRMRAIPNPVLERAIAGNPNPEDEKAVGQMMRLRGFENEDSSGPQFPDFLKEAIAAQGGGNELLSYRLAEEAMREMDPEGDLPPDTLPRVRELIAATFPSVKFLPKLEDFSNAFPDTKLVDFERDETGAIVRVIVTRNPSRGFMRSMDITEYVKNGVLVFDQAHLSPETFLSTLAGAAGDLSYSGFVKFKSFDAHCDKEFREIHKEIDLLLARGFDAISPAKKSAIAQAIVNWDRTEIGFIITQAMRYEHNLDTHKDIKDRPEAIDALWKGRYWGSNLEQQIDHYEKTVALGTPLIGLSSFTAQQDEALKELLQSQGYHESLLWP